MNIFTLRGISIKVVKLIYFETALLPKFKFNSKENKEKSETEIFLIVHSIQNVPVHLISLLFFTVFTFYSRRYCTDFLKKNDLEWNPLLK